MNRNVGETAKVCVVGHMMAGSRRLAVLLVGLVINWQHFAKSVTVRVPKTDAMEAGDGASLDFANRKAPTCPPDRTKSSWSQFAETANTLVCK
jgi:hypothetical protein